MTLLSRITGPADLKRLPVATLSALAQEIRAFLIDTVSREAVDVADGPTVIRYPEATVGPDIPAIGRFGQCDILRDDPAAVGLLIAVGPMAQPCLAAAEELAIHGVPVTVIDPRWIAPLDPALVSQTARQHAPREGPCQGDEMTPVQPGMPALTRPALTTQRRRASRQVMVGSVPVGGDAPVWTQLPLAPAHDARTARTQLGRVHPWRTARLFKT